MCSSSQKRSIIDRKITNLVAKILYLVLISFNNLNLGTNTPPTKHKQLASVNSIEAVANVHTAANIQPHWHSTVQHWQGQTFFFAHGNCQEHYQGGSPYKMLGGCSFGPVSLD